MAIFKIVGQVFFRTQTANISERGPASSLIQCLRTCKLTSSGPVPFLTSIALGIRYTWSSVTSTVVIYCSHSFSSCCGILLGSGTVILADNSSVSHSAFFVSSIFEKGGTVSWWLTLCLSFTRAHQVLLHTASPRSMERRSFCHLC